MKMNVLLYDFHKSVYGFGCFFREHGLLPPNATARTDGSV